MHSHSKLNMDMNIWKSIDEQKTEARLDRISPSTTARFDSSERRKCTENTREKVLSDLMSWKSERDGEKVCWINGMAGTGKTTIANSLCYTLDKNHELGASFFCDRSLPECRNVKFILPTIAYQLARFSNPFKAALSQALGEDPDAHTKVLQVQFERMILKPLQAVASGLPETVVVVIDALDECEDKYGVEQILDMVFKHASVLPVKFLVSSRPEHHIREKIEGSDLKTHITLHQLEKKDVKADIETYLRQELVTVSLTDDQLKILVERAGELFIYASTVARYIKTRNSQKRLDTVLRSTGYGVQSSNSFKGIDSLYEVVLTSALNDQDLDLSEKDQTTLILHTVVCAQEPLTVDALAGLLMLNPLEVDGALRSLGSVLHISNSSQVNVLHASFPEYILDPDRSTQFACNAEDHHGKLAELCFKRIERNNTQFNICDLPSSYAFDDDVPDIGLKVNQAVPFDLLYACQYWAIHLALGRKSERQIQALHEFLSKRLLLWMEVLNLNKRVDKGIGMMEKVVSWLQVTNYSQSETTKLLALDIRRFVSIFATSPISRSTPHLYISMLSSWPKSQPVTRYYAQRANGLPSITEIKAVERQFALLSSIEPRCVVHSLAFAPNGTFFAAGTSNNTILVWDALSCQMTIDPIKGHIGLIKAICISPDSTRICSGSWDGSIRVWDSQNGQLVTSLLESAEWVTSVDYSPDGQYIASGSGDGAVRIWSTHTKQLIDDPFEGNDGPVCSVAFSPDSSRVASGSDSFIRFWDPRSGKLFGDALRGPDGIRSLKFLPDGTHLVSISRNGCMVIWDLSSPQNIRSIDLSQEYYFGGYAVAISPSKPFCASIASDCTIRLWDTRTWQTHSIFWHTNFIESIAFSPEGSRLVSASSDETVRIWEVEEPEEKLSEDRSEFEGHSDWVRSVSFSPCGECVVSGSDDSTLCVWDAQTGRRIRAPLKGHNGRVISVGFARNGAQITSASDAGTIHIWNAQNGDLVNIICPTDIGRDSDQWYGYQEDWPVAFSSDGSRTAIGTISGKIQVLEGHKLILVLVGHIGLVSSIAFSPDQQFIISGSWIGELIVWNADTGEQLPISFPRHGDRVRSVSVSPDSSRVVSGSEDTSIRLWNAQNGELVIDPLQGHNGGILSVRFSPCGRYIVSGSQDRTVRLWNGATGESMAIFEGHIDWVWSAAFSSDGSRIVSGSADRTIRVWNVPSAKYDLSSGGSKHSEEPSGALAHDEKGIPTVGWTMGDDGWVRDLSQTCLLFWVSPDLRSILLRRYNEVLISRHGCVKLNLSGTKIGKEWITCYQPYSSSFVNPS
ncbi:putative WD repeat-containing protein all2124 [Nostoc sp, PCC 7120] [Rhizoctonia solani]|uniref:Putative WD repeat-containing protein all2124 [Nostoc sp, PCC 7120] n=1 Tax=Rhizoctonia solani TaxID=456999 RepID=A0A0K6GEV8_9AGAM|nr:putative WD repeat-containing protein all2124 [Nostoc sp, PCC 7120] [Rhizoctonia solani]